MFLKHVHIVHTDVCKLCDHQHILRTVFVLIQYFYDAKFCTSNTWVGLILFIEPSCIRFLILLRFVGGGSTVVRNILRASLADAACVRACIYTRSCSKAAWSGSVHTSNTWVGRAVSASTAVQSTPSKATTGWTGQPMTCAARVTATNGMRW